MDSSEIENERICKIIKEFTEKLSKIGKHPVKVMKKERLFKLIKLDPKRGKHNKMHSLQPVSAKYQNWIKAKQHEYR